MDRETQRGTDTASDGAGAPPLGPDWLPPRPGSGAADAGWVAKDTRPTGFEDPGGKKSAVLSALGMTTGGRGLDIALDSIEWGELSDAELIEAIAATERLKSYAQACRLEALAAFAATRLERNPGEAPESSPAPGAGSSEAPLRERVGAQMSRYAGDEVACELGWPIRTSTARLLDAVHALAALPRSTSALKAGRLDERGHARAVEATRLLTTAQAAEVDEGIDAWTAGSPDGRAPKLSQRAFSARLQRLVQHVDTRTPNIVYRQIVKDRKVWYQAGENGEATLTATGPAPHLRDLFERLERIARALPRGEGGTGDGKDPGRMIPDPATGELVADERTLDQRRFDALTEATLGGTVYSGGIQGRLLAKTASIHLHVPLLTALGHADLPAILDGHGPIPAQAATALLTGARAFTRVLTDPVTGQVLNLDRKRYRITGDLRAFLIARHPTCLFPACQKPAKDCDIDHVAPFDHSRPERGGPSDAGNLVPLSRHHHQAKTHDFFHLHRIRPPIGARRHLSPTDRAAPIPPLPVRRSDQTDDRIPVSRVRRTEDPRLFTPETFSWNPPDDDHPSATVFEWTLPTGKKYRVAEDHPTETATMTLTSIEELLSEHLARARHDLDTDPNSPLLSTPPPSRYGGIKRPEKRADDEPPF